MILHIVIETLSVLYIRLNWLVNDMTTTPAKGLSRSSEFPQATINKLKSMEETSAERENIRQLLDKNEKQHGPVLLWVSIKLAILFT